MDKNIINEELEKFRLLSSYSTKKTLSENIEEISEQYKSPEEEIFYNLVRATTGTFGTNEKLLKTALEKINNPTQYSQVEKMMAQRPIMGKHKTINTLLNDVLESDDAPTFLEIQRILQPKGINFTASVGKSGRQMNPNTIKVSFGKPAGEEVLTARGTDEPTGDLAKTKDLPGVVVKGRKNKNVVNPKNTPKLNFNPNDEFPLKFMDKGDKIKQLQTALGLKNSKGQSLANGNFYTATENAIKTKSAELGLNYDRKTGVDENMFDKIMGRTTGTIQAIGAERKRPDLSTGLPKNLPTVAPTLQAPTTDLSLEQQFQMAKMKLATAKQELDAAQETRDRAKIGAARGKQQAARAEVQRLRNELYPPQQ